MVFVVRVYLVGKLSVMEFSEVWVVQITKPCDILTSLSLIVLDTLKFLDFKERDSFIIDDCYELACCIQDKKVVDLVSLIGIGIETNVSKVYSAVSVDGIINLNIMIGFIWEFLEVDISNVEPSEVISRKNNKVSN